MIMPFMKIIDTRLYIGSSAAVDFFIFIFSREFSSSEIQYDECYRCANKLKTSLLGISIKSEDLTVVR